MALTWKQALDLVNVHIKKAIVKANHENDLFRVQYLKYCRKEIKKKLLQFKNNN